MSSHCLTAQNTRPSIVFVLFDDLGWGQPQSYDPDSSLRAPHLDGLASQGMRFTDAHSGAAVCTPTRYGVLTGRYPARIGQFGVLGTWSEPIIPVSRPTVASVLKQQGYDTACIGKWHLGLKWEGEEHRGSPPLGARFTGGPIELGFDYFCGYTHAANIGTILEQDRVVAQVKKEENQPVMLRKALEWIEKRDPQKPFFLYFPMGPPHYPVAPAPEFIGKSLLPLLTNPAGRARDWLSLFNFWGVESAQSMAVVSPEWNFIYWYYAGRGMKPTEELFHLSQDRIEMVNIAGASQFSVELVAARNAYDAELAAMHAKVIQGHSHQPYPVLFHRTLAWEKKEPLLKATKGGGGGEEEDSPKPNKKNSRKKAGK